MSAENEPVKCQEWLGDDSMTITSGTINIAGAPINVMGAIEDSKAAFENFTKGMKEPLTVSADIVYSHIINDLEKELKAWHERFPEYSYNSESELICYKVSSWEEEN